MAATSAILRSDPSRITCYSGNGAQWYVAYTCAHHEKRVWEQLERREIESYLPLYRSVRRWKDRRVALDLPLFPGYVFVKSDLRERLQVLQLPGVVRFVGFGGQPCSLPDQEIDKLRDSLGSGVNVEPCPYIHTGQRVRVRVGPLRGLEGIIVRARRKSRFVVSIDCIMRSAAVEINLAEVEPIL